MRIQFLSVLLHRNFWNITGLCSDIDLLNSQPRTKHIKLSFTAFICFISSYQVVTHFNATRMMLNFIHVLQVKVYLERRSLVHSLNDSNTAIHDFNMLVSVIVLIVITIVWLLMMGFLSFQVLGFISSQLLLLAADDI